MYRSTQSEPALVHGQLQIWGQYTLDKDMNDSISSSCWSINGSQT